MSDFSGYDGWDNIRDRKLGARRQRGRFIGQGSMARLKRRAMIQMVILLVLGAAIFTFTALAMMDEKVKGALFGLCSLVIIMPVWLKLHDTECDLRARRQALYDRYGIKEIA